MTRKAWVHRKGRKTWMFESSEDSKVMTHTTNKGTTYAIMNGMNCGKPFWIGKMSACGVALYTVEKELGSTYIEFEYGGEYWFEGVK